MRAFSLVELMIVMVIVVVVLAAAWPVASRFQIDSALNESATLLEGDLALAAADSQAGWLDNAYGIKFLTDTYVVYRGASYASREQAADRVVVLPRAVEIAVAQGLASGEISFNRQGRPRETGSLSLCHGTGLCKTLEINSLGLIKQQN